MSTSVEHHATASPQGDEEYDMPCAEALLAGTLALMTAYAQSSRDGHRDLMARKIATNIQVLARHPLLSIGFKTMLSNLQARWINPVQGSLEGEEPDPHMLRKLAGDAECSNALQAVSAVLELDQTRALWHKTPELAQ